jgi:hypothetical protein
MDRESMKSYIKLVGPVLSLMLITGNVVAQSTNSVLQQLAIMQVAVSNLQLTTTAQTSQINQLNSQQASQQLTITALKASNDYLRSLLQNASLLGQDMYVTGNLHIVNGLGSTETVNGYGNLIVGYNELRGDRTDKRTGSHNIVVGMNHNFSSYGGLVVGYSNTISGSFASVSGGVGNNGSGLGASVSGGFSNTASGVNSSVSGGVGNTGNGPSASVSGGLSNTASGVNSSVSGGQSNFATDRSSSVSGGYGNSAFGFASSISGGQSLGVESDYNWAAGSYHTP